jgi:putative zinc finger protein
MTHADIETQEIIDRYLLGKLPSELQEQFEQHFLACADCLEKLESSRPAVGLIAASRVIARRRWFTAPAWGMAAMLALAVWVTAGRSPTPPTPAPAAAETAPEPVIELSTFRGGGPATGLRRVQTAGPFRLLLDLQGLDTYESYSAEIASEQGATVWSRRGLAPVSDRALDVRVEGLPLDAGQYWVRLAGLGSAAGPALVREYSLTVQP